MRSGLRCGCNGRRKGSPRLGRMSVRPDCHHRKVAEHTELFKGTTDEGATVTVTVYEQSHQIEFSIELTAKMVETSGLRCVPVVLSNSEWMRLAEEIEQTVESFR